MSCRGPCCHQEDQQVVTRYIAQGKVVVLVLELNWASETDQSPATPSNPPTISPAKTYNLLISEVNPILDILELRDFCEF